nr:hypothetical protein GZ27A8_12 [uncultured archaeon GZfos27A8]
MQNTVMMPPNSFGCGMDISDRSSVRELACSGMPVPVHHRSGHPKVRVRFRMPPPESLMSSGDSCATKRTGFRVPVEFLVPACRRLKLPSRS